MIDYFVKITSFDLKRWDIVKDEPEISHRRTTVPGSYRTGDRFAGRRVVTIGGGSGTFSVLSHLKKYPFNITAIVTMSDSGGSSRMLMDEFHRQLPLGDLRQSLVALARNGALWREVFMHRFERPDEEDGHLQQRGVRGHSLGNLILKGLQDINNGDLLLAIEDAQELLNTAGRVLPVTLAETSICADLEDGTSIYGETNIDTRGNNNFRSEDAQELLNTAGRVLPVTLAETSICADLEDGTSIYGETNIDTRGNNNF